MTYSRFFGLVVNSTTIRRSRRLVASHSRATWTFQPRPSQPFPIASRSLRIRIQISMAFIRLTFYDLVAESEHYDTEGLLCWIVAVKRFGCVDPEHGDVLTFPDVTWTMLAKDPLPYLDAQWGDDDGVAQRVLPWLHFPFKIRKTETVLKPYGSRCEVHGTSLTVQRVPKLPLCDVLRQSVLRRREMDDWLQSYLTTFPCSGLPVNDDELLCCSDCRAAQHEWMNQIGRAIIPLAARPNAHGWVECPGCGTRFSIADADEFNNGAHLSCGQKIHLLERG